MIWILVLAAVVVAEVITALIDPLWGIVSHGVYMVLLILLGSFIQQRAHRNLCLSLSLAPMIRILSLSMPLAGFAPINWYLIISAPLIVATFVVIRMLKYRRSEVGLTFGWIPVQLAIAATGFILGVTEYFILRPEPLIASLTWQSFIPASLILLIGTGFAEEILFRGVMQKASLDVMGTRGLFYITAIFAALHIGYLSVVDIIFVFGVGIFFAWAVKKTGSILGATLSHGITNIMLYLILPFFL